MTSFFDYFIGYTVSLHVEAQRMMEELNTFEGGMGPRFDAPRAEVVHARRLGERRQLCFGRLEVNEDSHATGYGSRNSAEG